ncbi:MAG: hypothetical protein AABY22_18680 [Nanoarchaeota archaeon]
MKNLPYNESWTDRIRWSWLGRFWYWKIENKFLYSFRCFFNPKHNKVRKSIPRVWRDSDYLIVRTNFAIITEFYEDEFLGGFIDWDYDESHKEFKNWLIESYNYITKERPKLEEQIWAAYPKNLDLDLLATLSYDQKYGEVDRLEKEIDERDTKILGEYIKFRFCFWT